MSQQTRLTTETRTGQRQPTAAPSQAPVRVLRPGRQRPPAPDYPSRSHRLLPRSVRNAMASLGWWQNPIPLPPSAHLEQTLAVLERYGWGKSLDFSPTGRMCIRGAQTFLEHTGHVTPHDRARAVHYLQVSLHEIGITMPFFAWNDLPQTPFPHVGQRLNRAAYLARSHGE